jgi:hypothetical protein
MDVDYNRTGDVSLDYACNRTSYCTHHSDMNAPHCVLADETSDPTVSWTFYYTHYSDKVAPQYVYVDGP